MNGNTKRRKGKTRRNVWTRTHKDTPRDRTEHTIITVVEPFYKNIEFSDAASFFKFMKSDA